MTNNTVIAKNINVVADGRAVAMTGKVGGKIIYVVVSVLSSVVLLFSACIYYNRSKMTMLMHNNIMVELLKPRY